jgi:hypothetical protein
LCKPSKLPGMLKTFFLVLKIITSLNKITTTFILQAEKPIPMLKKLLILTAFVFFVSSSYAQFYTSFLPSPEFNSALEKIVSDFRYNFKNIAGDTLTDHGEVEIYSSKVTLPGATDCTVNKYHSAKDTTASWQAVVYNGEDYKEAVKVYKNTFRLINKSRIHLIDRTFIGFEGKMEQPTDEVRFTVSTLRLQSDDVRYKRFSAEVELLSTYTGFQVNINLSNKKPDNERE